MKKLVLLALVATSLAVSARALILGADIGYLTDNKDAYYSARVGWDFKSGPELSHQLELELGYTQHTDSETYPAPLTPTTITVKSKIQPITVNYRAETTRAGKLGYYFGAGVGVSRTSVSMPGSGVPTISDSASGFTLLAFTGVSYQASPTATLHLGAKYLWIDEVKLLGTTIEVGDDIALTAGVSFKF
jgi:opacity protein-like surface antigen